MQKAMWFVQGFWNSYTEHKPSQCFTSLALVGSRYTNEATTISHKSGSGVLDILGLLLNLLI